MPEGIDASSFEFYEGIRILVPGAVALGVTDGVVRTFAGNGEGLGFSTVVAIFIALLAGLVFYFVDAPAKAAVYLPQQPTDTLFAWGVTPKQHTTTLNAYFVMLDTIIPSSIRARALYMGSMYRIGMEVIYLLAVSSLVVLSSATWTVSSQDWSLDAITWEAVMAGSIGLATCVFAAVRDNRVRKKRQEKRPLDVQPNSLTRLDLAGVVIASVLFACLALFATHGPGWLLLLPIGLSLAAWIVRYFRGYAQGQKDRRRPITASGACMLLFVAEVLVLLSSASRDRDEYWINANEQRVWLSVISAALILICARGHEKRLGGAYATQNTWLTLNKDRIIREFFQADSAGNASPSTAEQNAAGSLSKKQRWRISFERN